MADPPHAETRRVRHARQVLRDARSCACHRAEDGLSFRGTYVYRDPHDTDWLDWCTALFRRSHDVLVPEHLLVCWIDDDGLVGEVYEPEALEGLVDEDEMEQADHYPH